MTPSVSFSQLGTDELRPRLKPGFRCEIVSAEGVILLSEQQVYLLSGNVYILLAPFLDGCHTVPEIMQRLEGRISAPEAFYALVRLRDEGCIIDTPSPFALEQATFWDALGVDSADVVRRLTETTVSVMSLGDIDPGPLQDQLVALGIQVDPHGEFCVILADDYLHSKLAVFNQDALDRKRSWMLVKPVQTELWLGPLFVPGKTGCWECLAPRLRGARKAEHVLQEKKGETEALTFPHAALPSTLHTAFSMAATEVAKWIICGKNETLEGHVVTIDTLSFAQQRHALVQRPQCPCCGTANLVTAQQSWRLILQRRKKTSTSDGSYRSLSAAEAFEKIERHVSPVTGIVNRLEPASLWTETGGLTSPYVAVHNFFHVARDYGTDWDVLRGSLHDCSGGKGKHPLQSKVSALCEAIERYSGVFQGDEARIQATYKELGNAAIHPNACMLYSEQQVKHRVEWNARGSRHPSTWVPEPFDEKRKIEWSPVWSLTSDESYYMPTAYCYYDYSRQHNTWFARADSNGCAAGHSKEEAILQAFMELVERDSVALWWYNRLKRPAVDLSTFDEPYFQELLTYYERLRRDVWVLDITSDLGIPAFAALARQKDAEVEGILFGFGAHLDSQVAILRALTEVDQQLPVFASVIPENNDKVLAADPEMVTWWKTATTENQPYLVPDETADLKVKADYLNRSSDDFHTDVLTCVELAAAKGLKTLVLDQTRPDIGLQVVKVIVPGLRHFWARFGPGRLYDVPGQMGWVTEPLTEDEMNPQCLYV